MSTKNRIIRIWIAYLFWVIFLVVMLIDSIKRDDMLIMVLAIITAILSIGVLVMAHRNLLKK